MTEIKNAVISYRMLVAISIAVLVLMSPFFLDRMWTYMAESDVLYLITMPMALSGFSPFACLFPIIPYGLRFAEEYNSNYIRFVISRYGRLRYILEKIFASIVSGGCVTGTAFLLVFVFFTIAGKPVTKDTVISEFYLNSIWEPYLFIWEGTAILLLKVVLAFLHGAVWALMALLVSAIYTNRYAAIVFPYAIYQVSWHLLSKSLFNPVYLLRGDVGGYPELYFPYVIQGLTILLLAILSAIFLWRKCDDQKSEISSSYLFRAMEKCFISAESIYGIFCWRFNDFIIVQKISCICRREWYTDF